jgi:hypothetical protein
MTGNVIGVVIVAINQMGMMSYLIVQTLKMAVDIVMLKVIVI